jgi:hypothetical protein
LEEFQWENRAGTHIAELFYFFSEIEDDAKEFTLQRCAQKSAAFTVTNLANFIDNVYYSATNIVQAKQFKTYKLF